MKVEDLEKLNKGPILYNSIRSVEDKIKHLKDLSIEAITFENFSKALTVSDISKDLLDKIKAQVINELIEKQQKYEKEFESI